MVSSNDATALGRLIGSLRQGLRAHPRKESGSDTAAGDAGVRVSAEELIGLRRLSQGLSLDSRRPSAAAIGGLQQSRFRGRGIDFQESRAYQPGDDIRNMDWRVTARSGRPHTKLYREERERPVILVLDLNPSMFFATRVAFKSVLAARAAALIGWTAVQHGDRVGAFMFRQGVHHEIPPAGGRRGALRLIRALVAWSEPGAADKSTVAGGLGQALRRLRRVARPGSLVVILSDFYSIDADTDHHLARLRQHNDLLACQVVDVLELTPPPPGRYGISDGERCEVLDTRFADRRRAYENYFIHHHETVAQLFRRRAVPFTRLSTAEDLVTALRRGLAGPSLERHTRRPVAEGTL